MQHVAAPTDLAVTLAHSPRACPGARNREGMDLRHRGPHPSTVTLKENEMTERDLIRVPIEAVPPDVLAALSALEAWQAAHPDEPDDELTQRRWKLVATWVAEQHAGKTWEDVVTAHAEAESFHYRVLGVSNAQPSRTQAVKMELNTRLQYLAAVTCMNQEAVGGRRWTAHHGPGGTPEVCMAQDVVNETLHAALPELSWGAWDLIEVTWSGGLTDEAPVRAWAQLRVEVA